MSDRGEKIVTLAREMLRADMIVEPQEPRTPASFKVLCVATLVAALGSSAVTGLLDNERRPLTRYEKVELDALLFYASRVKGLDEQNLRQEIGARTGARDIADFTEHDYLIAKTLLQNKIK